jgi:hypothetical protein
MEKVLQQLDRSHLIEIARNVEGFLAKDAKQ